MRIVYPPNGKLANYFYHKEYNQNDGIKIEVQTPLEFYSGILHLNGKTLQIQGHASFCYSKYATQPELEIERVTLRKGPLFTQVNVAKLKDQNTPEGTKIEVLGSNISLKVINLKIKKDSSDIYIKVAGIDENTLDDIVIEVPEKIITPPLIIKQETKFVITESSSSTEIYPVLVDVPRPEINVQIFKNSNTTNSDYGDLIYENTFYSFENPTSWAGNINFQFLDTPSEQESCKYSVVAKCNNADIPAPIIVKYAAFIISQIQ
ncbi:hypothetical protein [Oceanirhabdus seepicola]|uniref:Uncharacterized protein n=1 Tax=Oceanirhabdus seepicola TaxID=2828781 RepID=A0A9J6NXW6_9CLOT|nr:hypothetical protein [Oceanirhabdus seepicola]MCM1989290.1 hypothetical protein [Oceanirhabdus seepicola]